ncbi:hypothetical protein V5799_008712 [Amblyomma americanum]|uniref:Uncharacterized protein n=1 Tax=Amblyomma americanum TaxID=6943 RepID=A0AAQ4FD67_AMBAM
MALCSDPSIKRNLCKKCSVLLCPGITCTERLRGGATSSGTTPQKHWATKLLLPKKTPLLQRPAPQTRTVCAHLI